MPSFYYLIPENRLPDAPKIGQRVGIEGQPGEYVVLRLHMKRLAADLMLTTGNHAVEEGVPFFAIEQRRATSSRPNSEGVESHDLKR